MKIEETDLNYFEVGGSVRDRLMGRDPQDQDFLIVGHTVDEVVDSLGEDSKVIGEDFPVFLDEEGKECAMARTEEKIAGGHHGFEIHTSTDVTLEEDLSRRDLTINAMARNPDTGEIIDPFDGQSDLEKGIIRHTTQAFIEDPLRILRAARFAARFDFDIAGETIVLCRSISGRLTNISKERISQEMLKALTQAEKASTFFRTLEDLHSLNEVLPELESLRSIPAGPEEYHAEGDAFEHTMRVIDHSPATARCRLAALAHDLGKARTPVEEWPNHYGHDAEGVHIAERMANRLKLSNEYQGVMMDAAEQHMRFMSLHEMSKGKVIDLIERLDRSDSHITPEELLILCDSDGLGREPQTPMPTEKIEKYIKLISSARMVIDTIGGEEVLELHGDKEPGEWVGDRIHQLRVETLQEVIDGDAGSVAEEVANRFPSIDESGAIWSMRGSDELWKGVEAWGVEV